jgi:hypothetical protein
MFQTKFLQFSKIFGHYEDSINKITLIPLRLSSQNLIFLNYTHILKYLVQSKKNCCFNSKSKKIVTGTDRFMRLYCTSLPEEILGELFKQFIKIVKGRN